MFLAQLLLAAAPQVAVAAPTPVAPSQPPTAVVSQEPAAEPIGPTNNFGGTQNGGLFGTDVWFYFPNAGNLFTPVLLVGSNFGDSPTVFFGTLMSTPIINLKTPELPIIGHISIAGTLVPIYFTPGIVDMTIDGANGMSPAYPFELL